MDMNGGAAGLGSSGTSSVGGALAGSGSAGAPPFDPGDDPIDFPGHGGAEPLRAIAETEGWLGNVSSFEVAAVTDYAGDKSSAAWLPNESVARKWAELAKTGRVVDTSPPPAPRTLTALREGTSVRLSWTADADFDSGIKHFFVYRDNTKLAEVGSPFQQGNLGDEPEPALPQMTYSDASAAANPAYEVSTVNFFDLESGRSPTASP